MRDAIAAFCQNVIAPEARQIDVQARFATCHLAALADIGIMGLSIPVELGGAGLDPYTLFEAVACLVGAALRAVFLAAAQGPDGGHSHAGVRDGAGVSQGIEEGRLMAQLREVFRLACVLALLLVQASVGEAAAVKNTPVAKEPDEPPMLFAIVRSGITGCEPNCPQWISAEGQIMPGTATQFRKILKQVGKMRLPVVINSPGGDVEAALAMGRMIRERKLDVMVGWTLFTGCNPSVKTCRLPREQKGVYAGLAMTSRAYCLSACPFILAAGQKRMLGSGAVLGVHEITTQPVTQRIRYYETYRIINGRKKVLSRKVVSRKNIIGKVTTKLSKPFNRKLRAYLTTMGVDLALLDLLHLAPPSSIHTLTLDELKSTNLVTAYGNASELVSNSLCRATPPADNCKVEKQFAAVAIQPKPLPKVSQPPAAPPSIAKPFPPADSSSGSPMRFSLVRSSALGCEPLCPEWIFADGIITPATPGIFEWFLDKTKSAGLPLVIRSTGGHSAAAMILGRSIRKHGMNTATGAVLFEGCSTSQFPCRSPIDRQGRYRGVVVKENNYCNASCVLMLAGGKRRSVGSNNGIMVQKLLAEEMPAIPNALKISTASSQEADFQRDLGNYLDEMGISRKLMKYTSGAEPAAPHRMIIYELAELRVVTNRVHATSIVNNLVCKASPPADNCIKR